MPRKTKTSSKKSVTLKKIDPLSLAKIEALCCAIVGLIVGLVMTAFSAVIGFPYGAASIIILPIMYGIFGFIAGAIGAVVYNAIADWVGGIKLDFE